MSIFVVILSALLLIGLVWGNYRFTEYNIAGEGFSIQWISIRSLVTTGNSPYSDLVTTQIQESVKGENSFSTENSPRYTSPLYSGVVILPFALLENKTLAHTLWSTIQFVIILLILLFSLKITAWKPAWFTFFLYLLFTIFNYHVVMPWLDGGLSIWASLFLVLAFLAINNNRNEIGGVFLGLAAIQPLMVVLSVVFILIWAASQRRKLLILWFFITVIFLSVIGLFLVPDWIIQYIRLVYKFQQYFPTGTPGVFFSNTWPGVGRQLGWLVSGASAVILIIEWWVALRKDFRWFLWTACITIVISQWIGIPTIPGNFVGLILPMVLISAMFTERWSRGGQLIAVLMSLLLFIWQWSIYYSDLTSSQPNMQLNLIFPLPLVLLIGLYWVRWWVIKPKRLLIEELRLGESY